MTDIHSNNNHKTIDILMVDRNHLLKQINSALPGVPGAAGTNKEEKELPGVPGAESEQYKSGYKQGYVDGLNAHKQMDDESDDEDKTDAEEGSEQEMSSMSIVKKLYAFTKKLLGTSIISNGISPLYSEANGISIVTIDGELGKRLSIADKAAGKVDLDDITRALKIAKNANTSAVILHINSPGGTSVGVQEVGDVITNLTQTKPVFGFTDTIMASAGYWLGACSNGIFCTPTSELGSIGVMVKVMDFSESLRINGINPQIFTAGEYKAMGHGEKPLSDKHEQFIVNDIEKQYLKFKTLVSEYRGGVEDSTMQGQLFSGEEAIKVNLADEIVPDLETVINKLSVG